MVNYNELENSLFDEWNKSNSTFIRDGVVNQLEFNKQNFKISYLLKEVNDTSNNGNWDLRKYISEEANKRTPTWNNIVAWTYGITQLKNENRIASWDEIEDVIIDQNKKTTILNSICTFNLKKTPGGHTAKNNEIKEYVKSNGIFLKQQFNIYTDVDLFICCGTPVGSLAKIYIFNHFENWDKTDRGIWYKKLNKKQYAIYYCHPNARVDANLLFYGLIDAINTITSQ